MAYNHHSISQQTIRIPHDSFVSPPIFKMTTTNQTNEQVNDSNTTTSTNEFVILGSGVSTGIPRISCIIRPKLANYCQVCKDANENPFSKNRRCNVSALVKMENQTVLIDCGKTIREASMRHFPLLGINTINAIVLTHGHADAVLGLDDARDIQSSGSYIVNGVKKWKPPEPTPVFLNQDTMNVCKKVFPYLMPEDEQNSEKKDIQRRVASLSWNMYKEDEYFKPFYPLQNKNVEFTPIPMYHGGTYICMGFIIKTHDPTTGSRKTIAYLSDLHDLPERSFNTLKQLSKIDLLVIDVLTNSRAISSHFTLEQAVDVVKILRPVKAIAVGMTCGIGMHDDVNQLLKKLCPDNIDFQLAYDGLRYPC